MVGETCEAVGRRREAASGIALSSLEMHLREACRLCIISMRASLCSKVPTVEADLTLLQFPHPWAAVLST